MKVIVLTRGDLPEMLLIKGGRKKNPHRSNPYRKVVAELAEVSSTHSINEVVNHQGEKGWTVGRG